MRRNGREADKAGTLGMGLVIIFKDCFFRGICNKVCDLPSLAVRMLLISVFLMSLFPGHAGAIPKPPLPVIFIHGILGDAGRWAVDNSYLHDNGWTFGGFPTVTDRSNCSMGTAIQAGDFYTLQFSNNQKLSFDDQGQELACIIQKVLEANPWAPKVILVGHSMGGLAARDYLQFRYQTDNVAQLITIGTPHIGSPIASVLKIVCETYTDVTNNPCTAHSIDLSSIAFQSLAPGSPALEGLNTLTDPTHRLPPTVAYYSIIVSEDWPIAELLAPVNPSDFFLLSPPGDDIVSDASQNLQTVLTANGITNLTHSSKRLSLQDNAQCNWFWLVYPQSHTCETSDPGVLSLIVNQILSTRASYTPLPMVLLGQPAPGFPGGVFASLASNLMINNSGDVTFSAEVDTNGDGLGDVVGSFQLSNGQIRRITVPGFSSVTVIRTNNVSDLEFFDTSGSAGSTPIYLYRSASDSVIKVADIGQSTPVGGTFLNIYGGPLNDNGDVAFRASVLFGTTAVNYIFLYKCCANSIIPVVNLGSNSSVGGDITPVGGRFDPDALPVALTFRSDVIFASSVIGGTAASGIFRFSGTLPIKKVLVQGDPTPLGGTFNPDVVALSPSGSGPLVFSAFVSAPINAQGIFLLLDPTRDNPQPTDFIPVGYAGQPTNIVAGETFVLFLEYPSVTRSGSVTFDAVFRSGSIDRRAIFFWSHGQFTKIAVEGDCTLGGGVYASFSNPVLNDLGRLAFFVPQITSSLTCSAIASRSARTSTLAQLFHPVLTLFRKAWHSVASLLLGSEAQAATSPQGIFTSIVQVNNLPIANAGPDQSVSAGTIVTLDGTGSSDPDNDPLGYSWTQTAGPAVALSAAASVTATFTAPRVQAATVLTFQLIVNDGQADSAPATVNITVIVSLPDLIISSLSGPSQLRLGRRVRLPVVMGVKNQGTGSAGPSTVALVISPDPSIAGDDPVLGSDPVPPLGTGEEWLHTATLRATAPSAPGCYFLGAIADSAHAVAESDENNNTASFPLRVAAPLTIKTRRLSRGSIGVSYNAGLAVTGGIAPWTWTLEAGTPPPGLTLSPDGTIGGTPTTPGLFPLTVRVTDGSLGGPCPQATVTRSLTITIR